MNSNKPSIQHIYIDGVEELLSLLAPRHFYFNDLKEECILSRVGTSFALLVV
jgi:hypothetical protein